ncbi:MAG: M48 family metalloprotease [Ignavibacteriales bacterium]|nr:M48 family metalloprotease [Ignavibacteriales bacterium]
MKLVRKKIYIVALLMISACSAGFNIFSDGDEISLGEKFDKEIRNNPKEYPVYNNPAVKDYINKNIFSAILNSQEIKKSAVYKYQMELIQNDSTLNAFAVPGGYVYIYTGLLKYLDSEAALAGVLGHEIAHVERRHATQRITSAYGLSIVINLALGNNPSQITEMVANLFSGLTLLANSRSNEDESDEYSIKYLQHTKFYPGSVKFFFEKLRDDGKVSKGGEGIATFLSTHPDPIARINSAEQRLKELGIEVKSYKAEGGGIFKKEYEKNIKSKIK